VQDNLSQSEATVRAGFIGSREVYVAEPAHLQRWEVVLRNRTILPVLIVFMHLCSRALLDLG